MCWEVLQIAFITTEKNNMWVFFYMSVSSLTGTQNNLVKQYYTYSLGSRRKPV